MKRSWLQPIPVDEGGIGLARLLLAFAQEVNSGNLFSLSGYVYTLGHEISIGYSPVGGGLVWVWG